MEPNTCDKNEKGEIMLEALIVYSVTIFLLFFILALFCVFYQIWNIQTIANETASRIAQVYRYMYADIDTGYVSMEQVSGLERYRYLLGMKYIMELEAGARADSYIGNRLDHTSFVSKIIEPQIRFEVKKDALASRHVEVTVAEEFWVPFGTALSYFGFQDSIRYEAKAYAKCLDIIDYINMVDYV